MHELKRVGVGLGLGLFFVACAVEPADSGPESATGAATTTESGTSIEASAETQKDLGIAEWTVDARADGGQQVLGFDDSGKKRADVTISVSSDGKTIEATSEIPKHAELKLNIVEEDGQKKVTVVRNDFNGEEATLLILEHMVEDIENGPKETSLTRQNVRPLGRATGVPLRQKQEETCLRDSSGNGCKGQLLQTVGSCGAMVLTCGATVALIASGVGAPAAIASGAGCGMSAVSCAGSGVSMSESGCQKRPCSSK